MNERASIEKKLTRSFLKVASITAAVAILALIALIVISSRYSHALKNYGFAQGDIGRALYQFAEARSSLRAAIGYDDATAIQKAVETYEECKVAFEEAFAEVEKTVISDQSRAIYNQIKTELVPFWEQADEVVEIGASTDRARCLQAQEIAINELMPKFSSIYEQTETLLELKVEHGNSLSTSLTTIAVILSIVIIVVIGISMVLSTRIGRQISKGIAFPLGQLGQRLKTFSTGDLNSPFPLVNTGDEVEHMEKDATEMANNLNTIIHDISEVLGEMASGNYAVKSKNAGKYTGDFQKLYESMRGLRDQMVETLTSIGEVSNQVSSGSGDLADASQVLAEGATEQTNAIMELHATISEITGTMEKSAQSADESYTKAQLYADKADNSREEMNSMMAAMERINASSNRIGDIISEIESIASQTNLLSLNASIEAARAGESGRGFAVVADQIRVLANESAKAAIDSRELIESSIKEVAEGNRAAENAANALGSVVDGIKQIADFSKNLKTMVEDQTEAMRQAEKEINQISEVVQSNAATAEEASATSEELSAQASILDGLIGQFSLKK
ncbi:MAG: MCP four helix bundle domain-containing protein [Lachnospiraceae bacterium]|nr:MCP four helix bundle domain-containing protein [Lachnospiraceae bacterium]